MNEEVCPECGGELEHDEVDIGVGTEQGPPYCTDCGWTPDAADELEDEDVDEDEEDQAS